MTTGGPRTVGRRPAQPLEACEAPPAPSPRERRRGWVDWTMVTTDGTWSSHWEHSVALTEEGPLVLTAPDGGKAKLAEYGVTAAPDPLA
ncbi:Methionine Aminopeptidase Type I [Streptomyces leeuwenhoekii]|uniref:Methionine Aminopeptidase Type I n=1 Tax=Streptomyces leeuwenhoekii TaxID=1437453 RepID=A0A0F7VY00_STRLW|nr:Methionine Aminopeptidase Type I [Streptomyces leeuwenhoekii]